MSQHDWEQLYRESQNTLSLRENQLAEFIDMMDFENEEVVAKRNKDLMNARRDLHEEKDLVKKLTKTLAKYETELDDINGTIDEQEELNNELIDKVEDLESTNQELETDVLDLMEWSDRYRDLDDVLDQVVKSFTNRMKTILSNDMFKSEPPMPKNWDKQFLLELDSDVVSKVSTLEEEFQHFVQEIDPTQRTPQRDHPLPK